MSSIIRLGIGCGIAVAATATYLGSRPTVKVSNLEYSFKKSYVVSNSIRNYTVEGLTKTIERSSDYPVVNLTATLTRRTFFQELLGKEEYSTRVVLNHSQRRYQSAIEADVETSVQRSQALMKIKCIQSCSNKSDFNECTKERDHTELIATTIENYTNCFDKYCDGNHLGCPNSSPNIYKECLENIKCPTQEPRCLQIKAMLERRSDQIENNKK